MSHDVFGYSPVSPNSDASDIEFWTSLDYKPVIPDAKDMSQGLLDGSTIALSAISGLDDSRGLDFSSELVKRPSKRTSPTLRNCTPDDQIQRRYEKSLERVRRAKNVEVANSTIVAKHALTREFEQKVAVITHNFQHQKMLQQQNIEFLKGELNSKSLEVARLRNFIAEQEVLIAQLRILSNGKVTSTFASHNENAGKLHHSGSFVELQVELELSKAQVESLEQILKEERSDAAARNQEFKKLEEKFAEYKRIAQEDANRLQSELTRLLNEHQVERDSLISQLKTLKEEAIAESILSSEIQKRLQGAASSLQEELRTAKMLLTHPRLRARVVTRLRDVESMLIDSEEPQIVAAPSPSNPNPPRSARCNRRYRTAIRGSQPTGKVWNHKDHHLYMQSAELQRDLLDRSSSRRASSGYPSSVAIESKRS